MKAATREQVPDSLLSEVNTYFGDDLRPVKHFTEVSMIKNTMKNVLSSPFRPLNRRYLTMKQEGLTMLYIRGK